jgi:type VI secretion system VasD/TssJ family lipoprotein
VCYRTIGYGILSCALLLSGCSWFGPTVTIPPSWQYEKEAISLHIMADTRLNLFQKQSHSLLLCIYHLRDPNAFNQLLNQKDSLTRLLECERFDPSVVLARQLVVQPGQELTEVMDRAEGARFVNIAAGYYDLRKEAVIRAYEVPVSAEKKGGNLILLPKKLTIDLRLGPTTIETVKPAAEVAKNK